MPAGLQSIHIDTVPGWGNDDLRLLKNLKRLFHLPIGPLDFSISGRCMQKNIFRCCPGGFSTYILKKNKESTSVGVSLDPAQGGHPYLLEDALRVRQTVIFADMTTFQLVPNILFARDFDLVLLDAHHLRNQTGSSQDLLAISQVLLALLSIKFGGTIVMKLASPDSQYSATMLFMLDMLSASIQVHKPYAMHRMQNSFYVIARGVGGKPDRRLYLQNEVIPGLRRVWECLRQRNRNSGPRNGSGKEGLVVGDLDFIVDKKQLESYGGRLHELCSCVWKLQATALETLFAEMGIHNT
ncbi:hypothetical protein DFH05DRAFT_1517277 [Lentinula detonsa]|uniref:Ribosomal RNA methyltransferase FtsJ domain-containing protein n=1 Tax=Lentinula detonsa TaxID=2804962 RepID=A0A9W8NPX1_9AGAR|nr:hypothetical protein DFH05DRAFT_1517277 [Lentinula detonsa]